ncbi:hypothetical protein POTOM_001657 [Populus tomentosa]|uniref:Uncharacterized protein n=1 Tax=Populus tomentosa TaxID=118781 RepID=A0A8X8IVW7_POPTO|nr:hypothetical protein POTOM_001657 [Populus tomentosa]
MSIGLLHPTNPIPKLTGIGNIVYEGSEMKEIYSGIDDFSDKHLQVFSRVFGSCRYASSEEDMLGVGVVVLYTGFMDSKACEP